MELGQPIRKACSIQESMDMPLQNVAVIGAGGHVGLGLTLSIAKAGHQVYGIDVNEHTVASVSSGRVPFVEEGAEETLQRVLKTGNLKMTTDLAAVRHAEVIVIILGTPIDENQNPILEPLLRLFRSLHPFLHKGQLIILRSTVSPGTTDNIRNLLQNLGWHVGEDIFLVFAPERVVQGKSLEEIANLPQMIGAHDNLSFHLAEEFFSTFVHNRCLQLVPVEAELGKLMCNMARYVMFAIANEFSLIADEYGANVHRIFDACSYDYPRFNLPSPGPNVSGPCLFKDGFFLVQRFPLPDLISTAFKINESMPVQILRKVRGRQGLRKVGILGLTFKAGNDDIRYSLSFKLKRLLQESGYEVVGVDPFLSEFQDRSVLRRCDCVVLMTPHQEFRPLAKILEKVDNRHCWYIDMWGFWNEMRDASESSGFYGHMALRASETKLPEPVAV